MPTTLPEELLALIFENFAFPPVGSLGDILDDVRQFPAALGDVWAGEQPEIISTYRKSVPDEVYEDFQTDILECTKTLHSICLTSKNFHRLAWPILYRGFTSRALSIGSGEIDVASQPSSLLRTICLKPEYGSALRSLSIEEWAPIEAMDAMDLFNILQGDATIVALFQWRAKGFWLGDEPESDDDTLSFPGQSENFESLQRSLHRSLNMGLVDGHMTMLLLMCPNIRDLDISPPVDFATSNIAQLLRLVLSKDFISKPLPDPIPDFEEEESDYIVAQMFGARWPDQKLQKPLVLQQLRTLTIRSPGVTSRDLKFFKQLMSLPSLETLRVDGLRGGFPKAVAALDVETKCPQLKTLQLSECQLNALEVAAIVKCCPNLEKVYIVWLAFQGRDGRNDHWTPELCIDYGLITTALAENCPNLTVIKLGGSEGRCNVGAEPKHPFTIGKSLDSLEHLAVLQIDAHSIYGSEHGKHGSTLADNVPKNLVALEVSSWHEDEHPMNSERRPELDAFQDYQDEDLDYFLKDERFHRLGRLELPGRIRIYDVDRAREAGWEILKRDNAKGHQYEVLINKARLEAHGFERFAN
ncbi:hypothetical protein Q7P37_009631 [Cladosporium fusiforme]